MQNLLKKHQALQAEIAGHEPRIKAVTQKGNGMVDEGGLQVSFPMPFQITDTYILIVCAALCVHF